MADRTQPAAVVAVFSSKQSARQAMEALKAQNFQNSSISLDSQRDEVAAEAVQVREEVEEVVLTITPLPAESAKGGVAGSLIGAVVGAVVGLLIGWMFDAFIVGIIVGAVGGSVLGFVSGGFLGTQKKLEQDEDRENRRSVLALRSTDQAELNKTLEVLREFMPDQLEQLDAEGQPLGPE